MRGDCRARFAAMELARAPYVPDVVLPPQVRARPPYGRGEVACYQGKQAAGLGRAAAARGWSVGARYWRAHDGAEGCAVSLRRTDLAAVATWSRKAGNIGALSGWSADVAYGWRIGTMPARINHTNLVEMITNDVI